MHDGLKSSGSLLLDTQPGPTCYLINVQLVKVFMQLCGYSLYRTEIRIRLHEWSAPKLIALANPLNRLSYYFNSLSFYNHCLQFGFASCNSYCNVRSIVILYMTIVIIHVFSFSLKITLSSLQWHLLANQINQIIFVDTIFSTIVKKS